MQNKKERLVSLYETLASTQTALECKRLLEDLCTDSELNAMAQRLHAAKMLMEGNTYEQIIAKTDLSSTTLSRVSKCVKNGNGYKNFVK